MPPEWMRGDLWGERERAEGLPAAASTVFATAAAGEGERVAAAVAATRGNLLLAGAGLDEVRDASSESAIVGVIWKTKDRGKKRN